MKLFRIIAPAILSLSLIACSSDVSSDEAEGAKTECTEECGDKCDHEKDCDGKKACCSDKKDHDCEGKCEEGKCEEGKCEEGKCEEGKCEEGKCEDGKEVMEKNVEKEVKKVTE